MQYGAQYREYYNRWREYKDPRNDDAKTRNLLTWRTLTSRRCHITAQKAPQWRQRGITKRPLDHVFCWVATSDLNILFKFMTSLTARCRSGLLSRYSDLLRTGRSAERIPVGARFSAFVCTGPGGSPSLLYNEYRVFHGGGACKAAAEWRWPHTPSIADVKERVQLYLCSPSAPSWPVLGWI